MGRANESRRLEVDSLLGPLHTDRSSIVKGIIQLQPELALGLNSAIQPAVRSPAERLNHRADFRVSPPWGTLHFKKKIIHPSFSLKCTNKAHVHQVTWPGRLCSPLATTHDAHTVPGKHRSFTSARAALVLQMKMLRLQGWVTCQGLRAEKPWSPGGNCRSLALLSCPPGCGQGSARGPPAPASLETCPHISFVLGRNEAVVCWFFFPAPTFHVKIVQIYRKADFFVQWTPIGLPPTGTI